MDEPIIINGRLCPSVDARDRGFAYGHGVFETIKLTNGQLPLIHLHEERLDKGLSVLGIPCGWSSIQASLDLLLANCVADGVVKLVVTAGITARGYGINEPVTPTVVVWWSAAPEVPENGVCLETSSYRLPENSYLAGIKHLNRLDQVIAATRARPDCIPLLLDTHGRVVEALSHNVFICREGRWLTPALEFAGVAGVMRALLLDKVFPALGIDVEISNFGLEVVTSADEVFVCNSVQGVQSVTALASTHASYKYRQTDLIKAKLAELFPCYPV